MSRCCRTRSVTLARYFLTRTRPTSGLMKSNTTTLSPIRLSSSGRPIRVTKSSRMAARTFNTRSSYGSPGFTIGVRVPSVSTIDAEVRREDDDGLGEVHGGPGAVGEPAVLQDLQELVQDPRVRLLDLVEEHDAERALPDRVRELAAGVVADVAGRRADQPRLAVLGGELAHVEPDVGVLVAEEHLASDLASSVLPTPVGPAKNSTPCGRVAWPPLCAPVRPIELRIKMSSDFRMAAAWPSTRTPSASHFRGEYSRARPVASTGCPRRRLGSLGRLHRCA